MLAVVLSKLDIQRLLRRQPPLVEGWLDLEQQVQANGFDLSLREVAVLESAGRIAADNSGRQVSELSALAFNGQGFVDLAPGPYVITYNEIVHLPNNVMALGEPRSSLLRCGVAVHMAVWDAGYSGRSQSMMVVHNPRGFRLERNARVAQLVFLRLTRPTEGYRGAYQRENM
ncbi:MAG: deoxyuridine 5'-triphosphate nucleotidohydrolase [Chloroflexota bacterium]